MRTDMQTEASGINGLFFWMYVKTKGEVIMIPCREGCPQYEEGCHKTCQKWKDMQEKLKIEKKRKKSYLEYHNKICSAVIRQCYESYPHRFYWFGVGRVPDARGVCLCPVAHGDAPCTRAFARHADRCVSAAVHRRGLFPDVCGFALSVDCT